MTTSIADRLVDVSRVFDLPALVCRVGDTTSAAWATAMPVEQARRVGRLVISGCGDSLFAGVAARLAIERFGGLPCEALDAMECGRYASVSFSPNVAVLGISNSGTTSRVLESLALARRSGALTVALTGTPESPLERIAGAAVVRQVVGAKARGGPTARVERHFGEYVGTLAALYHLALHLGEARGVLTARERRDEAGRVQAAAEAAQRALVDVPGQVAAILDHLRDTDRVYFLGAGPAYGTVLFGAAKLVEEVPLCGVPQHLEGWAHLEYFLTMIEGSRTRAVVVAPPGDSTDRAVEILRAIRDDGGFALAVTHPAEDVIRQAAAAAITVDAESWEGYAPIPYAVPVQWLGIALAWQRGQTTVPLGRRDGGRLIRGSAVRGVPEG
jgi:glucosamine--fructose-6-phosphate aminotransferase (isomerizing)